MALSPGIGWLFVGRLFSGITTASIPTATAYIADVTTPEKRAAGFGMLGAAFGLGFVLGPALGGVLGEVNPRLPFWVAAGLSLANAFYGMFVLPESLGRSQRAAFSWSRANPVASLNLLRSHPELLGLTAILFLFYLAHEVFPSVYVLYANYRFDLDARTVGLMLATAGVGSAVVQAVHDPPGGVVDGGTRHAHRGHLFRHAGFCFVRAGTGALAVLAGDPVDLALGSGRTGHAVDHVAARGSHGAGAAPGRDGQPARHHGDDGAGVVHVDVRGVHPRRRHDATRLAICPARRFWCRRRCCSRRCGSVCAWRAATPPRQHRWNWEPVPPSSFTSDVS